MTLDDLIGRLVRAGWKPEFEQLRDAIWLLQQDVSLDCGFPPSDGLISGAPDAGQPEEAADEVSLDALLDATATGPPSSPRPPPRPPPSRVPVHAVKATGDQAGASGARRISLPASRALPERLAMTRAMRPFRRPFASPVRLDLDEEATAETMASMPGVIQPIFRPGRERWYTAEIVVEDDPVISVWRDTAGKFKQMLRDTGAFRDVRQWQLRTAGPRPAIEAPSGARFACETIGGSATRTMIFFLTHGASPKWADGQYHGVLEPWSRRAGVVLVQVLPHYNWSRTVLGEPEGTCRALEAGTVAAGLRAERYWWTPDAFLGRDGGTAPCLALPLIALEPRVIGQWARMQMGAGATAGAVFIEPATPGQGSESDDPQSDDDIARAAELVRAESPDAFRLGIYLCRSGFTLPVARLVQEAMFGEDHQHASVAELIFSGIVYADPHPPECDPDLVGYRFHPAAQTLLQRSLNRDEAEQLGLAVERHIEHRMARMARIGVLAPDPRGRHELPSSLEPFARLRIALLGEEPWPDQAPAAPPTDRPVRVCMIGTTTAEIAAAIGATLAEGGLQLTVRSPESLDAGDSRGGVDLVVLADPDSERVLTHAYSSARGSSANPPILSPPTTEPGRTLPTIPEATDIAILVGDDSVSDVVVRIAALSATVLLPLWSATEFAAKTLYSLEERRKWVDLPRQEVGERRKPELDAFRARLLSILTVCCTQEGRSAYHDSSATILFLLDQAGTGVLDARDNLPHPRISLFRRSLRAATGGTKLGGPQSDSDLDTDLEMRLARVANQASAWIVEILLALNSLCEGWPAGDRALAIGVAAMLRAGERQALDDLLQFFSARGLAATPLAVLLRHRLRSQDASPDAPEEVKPGQELTMVELARQFLDPIAPMPEFLGTRRTLARLIEREEAWRTLPEMPGDFLDPDPAIRTLAYCKFLAHPAPPQTPPFVESLAVERTLAHETRETRPLWLLLHCLLHAIAKPPGDRDLDAELADKLGQFHAFLEAAPLIDRGGECKDMLLDVIKTLG